MTNSDPNNSQQPPQQQPGSSRPPRPRRNAPLLLLMLGLVAIIVLVMSTGDGKTKTLTVLQLDQLIEDQFVAELTVHDGKRVTGKFRDIEHPYRNFEKFEIKSLGPPGEGSALTPERRKKWMEGLDAYGAKFDDKESSTFLSQFPTFLLWIGLLLLFWFFVIRQMMGRAGGGNVMQFGKSKAKMHTKERSNVTFDDVAGIEEAEDEVSEIVAFLKSPQKFKRIGARIPRGVMLVGPPGCGKTLLAKAIAGEAGVPFFSVSGSDFVEMFVGVGASRVRDLFKQARESSPCIVFLDEIDAVGRRRGTGLGGGHDEREQTLNQILVEMDGFDTDQGIILLAATNRPDVLDPALLRPGRFDRNIVINLPDVKGREQILRIHSRKVKMAPAVDLARVARATPGFSGADLEALVNESALMAVTAGREAVSLHDLEEARDKIRFGRSRKSMLMSDKEKRVTAYHEAGHSIITVKEEYADPLHKVTIIPRGMALGVTMALPEQDRHGMGKKEMLARLRVCFGGRIAEALVCDDITSGAQNDIEQATELARLMVTKWGMSEKVGPISLAEGEEHLFLGREVTRTVNHSEATAQLIDDEVKRLLTEAYAAAEQLLQENMDGLHAVSEALLEHETLSGEEVNAILRGEDLEEWRKGHEKASTPTPPGAPAGDATAEDEAKDGERADDGRPAEGFAY
ncbi:MAG: ATP-dependent zinc metalloprotease FtsH [Planctomycetota bacterium]|nr:ATP-dependent zinc metalloprotease FtsH [Planctomycetota bacterium]